MSSHRYTLGHNDDKGVTVGDLVEFPLAAGGSILVRTADTGSASPATRGLGQRAADNAAQRASQSFEDAIDRIRPAADSLLAALTALTHTPDEVNVEFGVELTAEAGAFIANIGSTANFKVSLVWRNSVGR